MEFDGSITNLRGVLQHIPKIGQNFEQKYTITVDSRNNETPISEQLQITNASLSTLGTLKTEHIFKTISGHFTPLFRLYLRKKLHH